MSQTGATSQNTARVEGGFSLIELMIAVVVVGILSAIAYPSYVGYEQQSRRSDAYNALARAQLQQEKWRANNATYASRTQMSAAGIPTTSANGNYAIDVPPDLNADLTAGYTFTATPVGAQQGDTAGGQACQ